MTQGGDETRGADAPAATTLRAAGAPAIDGARAQASPFALPLFAITIFTSAALLFSVQPMFAKLVLPRLGGSPSVWSVAMVVFQTLLLAGYAYAHALTRWLPGLPGLVTHVIVTLLAALTLPFSIRMTGAPPVDGEMFYVIAIFLTSIGASFFALSANGPLLQAWFTHTGHDSAQDPYFLYAASNIGSFLALFAYPLLLEPALTLSQQRLYWTWGYWLLAALLTGCALLVSRTWRTFGPALVAPGADEARDRVTPLRFVGWVALSAVPSGLLVAVTAQISTDIASAPMLWVIPLALYLVTFVVVFQKRPVLPHRWMLFLHPFAVAAVIGISAADLVDNIAVILFVHLAAFFIAAMVCHGELVKRRPGARQLTAFYLAMSLGGMLGGMFSGLIAPRVFSWVAEYPLLIVLSLLCRPGEAFAGALRRPMLGVVALIAIAAYIAAGMLFGRTTLETWTVLQPVLIGVALLAGLAFWRDRLRLAVAVAACFLIIQFYPSDGRARQSVRSFFGVHKISETPDGRFRLLSHGTTVHGVQELKTAKGDMLKGRPEPVSYYYVGGPFDQALKAARANAGGASMRVGVVGLGAGSLVCHAQPGDDWRYYEIDAEVERIARDTRWFTFMSGCAPDSKVVLGDARLTLAATPDGDLDALVIDAFTSDAIPVHLITHEAIELYKKKLKPHGLLIMHISNRHMELTSVVANVAQAAGMVVAAEDVDAEDLGIDEEEYRFDATLAVLARDEKDLFSLYATKGWGKPVPTPSERPWSDDYSNILGSILRNWRGFSALDAPEPPRR